ncbi:MAG TPA: 30S ribosomal protein S13 [Candidatus Coatesbacteria bacterium]|nr:30S ribosomal protein S13 [Candidatus Coatesbacteria bacterium]
MARIAGIDLPRNKRVVVSLTYIFGIGATTARDICRAAGVDVDTKTKDLTDDEITSIRKAIEEGYRVEGTLRAEIAMNIKRLMAINCYRGMRHKRGLPVRGQRTKTNARTRKGPRRTVGAKRKK